MCKELPVITVNKAVDPKILIRKNGGRQGGGEPQGVADPKKCTCTCMYDSIFDCKKCLKS
jgi:hypothetical protein